MACVVGTRWGGWAVGRVEAVRPDDVDAVEDDLPYQRQGLLARLQQNLRGAVSEERRGERGWRERGGEGESVGGWVGGWVGGREGAREREGWRARRR